MLWDLSNAASLAEPSLQAPLFRLSTQLRGVDFIQRTRNPLPASANARNNRPF
jgi:hypothetical protein